MIKTIIKIQGGNSKKLDPATFKSSPAIKGIKIISITEMSALIAKSRSIIINIKIAEIIKPFPKVVNSKSVIKFITGKTI